MSETQGAASGLTREEQNKLVMPMLRKYAPQIVEVAKLYNDNYPISTTPPAVIDAVTVALPLRHFMVMAAMCINLVAAEIAAEKPAA